ncbi:MAG TPA: glycosyltransferase [Chthoniobacteraceae bacterium]|nr:glycosyltransferase [Chthoniobacteraceae bacterium]
MSPLVTIGIPCYNAARWIKAAVDSALAQTWPAKEIIVVDDGSTDGSRDILKNYGDAIRVIFADHRGSNPARNEILRASKGEWIQYLDADDFLLPEKITKQFSETDGGADCDVIYSPVWIDQNNERRASALDASLDVYCQWLAWELPQTGGCLWRKSTLEKLHGWNEQIPCCQEHELYLRALKAGMRFRLAPSPNAVYRIWSDETLCRRDPRLVTKVKTQLIDDMRSWMELHDLWTPASLAVAGQACFELSRSIARDNLMEADTYHQQRREVGLIAARGPAAPASYRFVYKIAGFKSAERVARAIRGFRKRK